MIVGKRDSPFWKHLFFRCGDIFLGWVLSRSVPRPSSLSELALMPIRGGSKGVCPIGCRTHVREGEAVSVANVGRGKAKRFPLQGHLSPRGEPLTLRALRRSTPSHPSILNKSRRHRKKDAYVPFLIYDDLFYND